MTGRAVDPEREALIRQLLAKRGLAGARPDRIPRRAPDARVPLSPLQEGMWFLDQLDPGGSAYVLGTVVRLRGALEAETLRRAVDAVVARHEALRTSFAERDGRPEQVVHPPEVASRSQVTTVDDLSHLPAADREEQATAIVQAELETGFDLGRAPLLRVRLVRIDPTDHLLAVSVHHIVCDERSLSLMLEEILDGYQRLRQGGSPRLDPPEVQYPDYVLWRRDALAGPAGQAQRQFWQRKLAGSSGVLALPTDRPRPAVQTFSGATATFPIDAELTAELNELARRTGCTRFMLVLTALKLVLARWSGQDDICVGSPVSTRTTAQLQSVVGLLVNSLPLRTDLSGDPTVAEALARVRQTCVESLDHADLPLDQLAEQARVPRDPGRNPLFQVMCVVNPMGGPTRWGDLEAHPVGFGRQTSRMDLTLMVYESPTALSGLVDYNTDLFDPVTIDRFVDRFRLALRALTRESHRRLSELDLRGPAERADQDRWNHTDRPYPSGTLHELIRKRAAAAPQAPAVIDGDTVVSYGQLDERSGLLAARLRAAGAGADVPIGLALPASAAAIVGLLGVLRAGGGYLPLDPTHPPARLLDLLADAGAPVVVTAQRYADRFAGFPGTVLMVDAEGRPTDAAAEATAPDGGDPDCHPDQLAYLIYTSGSTGTPKGVRVNHRSAVNLAHAFVDLHGIGPDDRLLMLPPLSFDASVGDVFPVLVSGAALVLHPRPAELTGPGLLDLCGERGITLVDTAVALWIRWTADLADTPPRTDTPLRAVMVGGEAVPVAAVRDWARATGGRVPIYNHYGPTEATVCATTYRTVDASELPEGLTHLPIGRPLPNVRAYLLDRSLRPVPVGAVGEIHIGGVAPARGYHGAPGTTAARFRPDPAGPPGARMYATGDLGRHRADGTIEFLGRADRQVKIRGHRIEIGEVEAACAALPEVARAAVTVRDDGAGPRLVGYLVPAGDARPDPAQVRAALRRRLPDYLVPAAFVVLPELPLTTHGKVDVAALPAPDTPDGPASQPPRTDTERALAAIWADLLRTESIGRQDNFFDRGGHSLLVGPLAARIADELGVTLPLRAIFETVDLAGLAGLVDEHRSTNGSGVRAVARPEQLAADAELDDDIRPSTSAPPALVPRSVLVTGATGFLGAHLVADWLRHSEATLYCLVRAGSAGAAMDRVRENLLRYGLWRNEYARRLVGVPGDLGEPLLGLGRGDFAALADCMDAVIHNGGVVNFLLPYERLRPANVQATREILRLAATGRPTAVHLVSTLGVYLTPGRRGTVVRESDPPDDYVGLTDGYNASKWVSDALARAARERGLVVNIYRPARITGHSVTGVGNADDYFSRLLKTFVQLGAVPEITDDPADLAPVDHVAAAIGYLARQPELRGGDFHFYNNRTISFPDLAAALSDFGYPVEVVPYQRWRAALLARPDAALAAFAPLFGAATPRRTQPSFDCTATETALAGAGLVCPAADAALVHTYLEWFVSIGFLDPPRSRPSGSVVASTGRMA